MVCIPAECGQPEVSDRRPLGDHQVSCQQLFTASRAFFLSLCSYPLNKAEYPDIFLERGVVAEFCRALRTFKNYRVKPVSILYRYYHG